MLSFALSVTLDVQLQGLSSLDKLSSMLGKIESQVLSVHKEVLGMTRGMLLFGSSLEPVITEMGLLSSEAKAASMNARMPSLDHFLNQLNTANTAYARMDSELEKIAARMAAMHQNVPTGGGGGGGGGHSERESFIGTALKGYLGFMGLQAGEKLVHRSIESGGEFNEQYNRLSLMGQSPEQIQQTMSSSYHAPLGGASIKDAATFKSEVRNDIPTATDADIQKMWNYARADKTVTEDQRPTIQVARDLLKSTIQSGAGGTVNGKIDRGNALEQAHDISIATRVGAGRFTEREMAHNITMASPYLKMNNGRMSAEELATMSYGTEVFGEDFGHVYAHMKQEGMGGKKPAGLGWMQEIMGDRFDMGAVQMHAVPGLPGHKPERLYDLSNTIKGVAPGDLVGRQKAMRSAAEEYTDKHFKGLGEQDRLKKVDQMMTFMNSSSMSTRGGEALFGAEGQAEISRRTQQVERLQKNDEIAKNLENFKTSVENVHMSFDMLSGVLNSKVTSQLTGFNNALSKVMDRVAGFAFDHPTIASGATYAVEIGAGVIAIAMAYSLIKKGGAMVGGALSEVAAHIKNAGRGIGSFANTMGFKGFAMAGGIGIGAMIGQMALENMPDFKGKETVGNSLTGAMTGEMVGMLLAPLLGPLAPFGPLIGAAAGALVGAFIPNLIEAGKWLNDFGKKVSHAIGSDRLDAAGKDLDLARTKPKEIQEAAKKLGLQQDTSAGGLGGEGLGFMFGDKYLDENGKPIGNQDVLNRAASLNPETSDLGPIGSIPNKNEPVAKEPGHVRLHQMNNPMPQRPQATGPFHMFDRAADGTLTAATPQSEMAMAARRGMIPIGGGGLPAAAAIHPGLIPSMPGATANGPSSSPVPSKMDLHVNDIHARSIILDEKAVAEAIGGNKEGGGGGASKTDLPGASAAKLPGTPGAAAPTPGTSDASKPVAAAGAPGASAPSPTAPGTEAPENQANTTTHETTKINGEVVEPGKPLTPAQMQSVENLRKFGGDAGIPPDVLKRYDDQKSGRVPTPATKAPAAPAGLAKAPDPHAPAQNFTSMAERMRKFEKENQGVDGVPTAPSEAPSPTAGSAGGQLMIANQPVEKGKPLTKDQMGAISLGKMMGNDYPPDVMKQYEAQKGGGAAAQGAAKPQTGPSAAPAPTKGAAPSPTKGGASSQTLIGGQPVTSGKPLSKEQMAAISLGKQMGQNYSPEVLKQYEAQKGGATAPAPTKGEAPSVQKQVGSTNPNDPRGIRNNNPLNLSYVGQKDAIGSDGRFAKYATMQQGVAADERQLLKYQDRDKLKSVAQIIGKWAPSNENNTNAYASTVAKALGVKPTDSIDLHDPKIMAGLVGSMAKVETGRSIDPNTINMATRDVLGGPMVASKEALPNAIKPQPVSAITQGAANSNITKVPKQNQTHVHDIKLNVEGEQFARHVINSTFDFSPAASSGYSHFDYRQSPFSPGSSLT